MQFGPFEIPDEIAIEFFQYLNQRELARLALVSKEFKRIAEDTVFWEQYYRENFRLAYRAAVQRDDFAMVEKYPLQSKKDIINKVHRYHLRRRDVREPWQIVLLLENMDAIKAFFSTPEHLEYIRDIQGYGRQDYMSPLHYAAFFANQEMFNFFHALGIPIDLPAREDAWVTPFHCAAWMGNVTFMAFLLSKGAKPTENSADKLTVAHFCAHSGNIKALQYALTTLKLSATSLTVDGSSIAHFCARSGNVDILRYALTDLKLSATRLTNDGNSLLHLAAMSGKQAPVEYLLQDFPQIDISHRNTKGETAKDCARGLAKALLEQRMINVGKQSDPGSKANGCTIS